ncbi:hypothetical protein [Planomicrobium sp. YIM 101495]|uniref:hypothetical protein n=1 Tax=Planomicrobium sp. YIM 101495 TaxID=2665160 RepID=UPI0018AB1355|nr:hypothetical protein [Planomicrobium sp. YIM 101495]
MNEKNYSEKNGLLLDVARFREKMLHPVELSGLSVYISRAIFSGRKGRRITYFNIKINFSENTIIIR